MGKIRTPDRDRILDLACKGHPPREISAMMGMDANTVSGLLCYERRKGNAIPHFKTGPGLVGHTRFVILDPPRGLRDALIPHAEARGVTVSELAGALLKTLARDDLVDAILDDGDADD